MIKLVFHSVIHEFNYFFWKDISGFEGGYAVSLLGVLSKARQIIHKNGFVYNKSEKHIQPIIAKVGYLQYSLWRDNKGTGLYFHRLFASAFKFNHNPDARFIDHVDGNKLNNNLSNLDWVTQAENNRRAYKTGLKNGDHKRKCRRGIHPSAKRVIQMDSSLAVVKTYDCKLDAEDDIGVTVGYFIKNQRKCPKGYFWKYA